MMYEYMYSYLISLCWLPICSAEQLLQKDRRVRLGAREDLDELKRTAFFASIDFHALNARQIPAPYTPAVQDELDTRNIDREFTDMPVPSTSYLTVKSWYSLLVSELGDNWLSLVFFKCFWAVKLRESSLSILLVHSVHRRSVT